VQKSIRKYMGKFFKLISAKRTKGTLALTNISAKKMKSLGDLV
jgi:hypothetical protein